MNRRRFIVIAGISAGAVGGLLAVDSCSNTINSVPSNQGPVPPGPLVHELTCQYATTNIKGYKLRTRTYNGRTIGPVFQTRPGQTLSVRVINRLPPNPPAKPPDGVVRIPAPTDSMEAMEANFRGGTQLSQRINPTNNPHGFNTTNLHVHGIQTTPHIFAPIGTSDPTAMMLEIPPGQSFLYNFPIPSDHPSGLHWYHPHKHGSTDLQVSGGMAGLIVVRGPIDQVPEIAAAREIFIVVQSLNVNYNEKSKIYEREYVAYRPPDQGGYALGTDFTMLTINGEGAYWVRNATKTSEAEFKPLGIPEYDVRPGEVVRLRMLNGTNGAPLFLTLPGFETWEIGLDGINTLTAFGFDMSGTGITEVTPENLFTAPILLVGEANRLELLIRAPKKEGTYTLSSIAARDIFPWAGGPFDVARFNVSGSAVKMSIPNDLPKPTREYPLIKESEIVAHRTFTFDQGKRRDLLTGFGFTVNGKLYEEMECPTQPKVGTCEEWLIVNKSVDLHPFHLHENSFQLIKVNDVPVLPVEIWDTFPIPQRVGSKNGTLLIRVRFVQWTGKTVFHCHVLPHEDTGMMQNILMT
ncbi:MAG: multicopper oxidase domain-containing protein [Candidatus Eremiobacteraeota bacterium]|nr:multicopper oxidase domain-containing protein [Candidatus Eremiobacteraeota bacterium]